MRTSDLDKTLRELVSERRIKVDHDCERVLRLAYWANVPLRDLIASLDAVLATEVQS